MPTSFPGTQQYYEIRSRDIQALRQSQQPNPYPHKFHVTIGVPKYIEKYKDIEAGQRKEGVTEALAGRIHNIRESSSKLRFYDLHAEGMKVQIMANMKCVPFFCIFDSVMT